MPATLTLHQIRVDVAASGFRTRGFVLITTLTDTATYNAADLAALYYRRWDVELFFRDLKTTMGMDILRCQTPAGVRNEIRMHWIVYNATRLLMWEAARDHRGRRLDRSASRPACRRCANAARILDNRAKPRPRYCKRSVKQNWPNAPADGRLDA